MVESVGRDLRELVGGERGDLVENVTVGGVARSKEIDDMSGDCFAQGHGKQSKPHGIFDDVFERGVAVVSAVTSIDLLEFSEGYRLEKAPRACAFCKEFAAVVDQGPHSECRGRIGVSLQPSDLCSDGRQQFVRRCFEGFSQGFTLRRYIVDGQNRALRGYSHHGGHDMDILNELSECMQRGDDARTIELTQQAIDAKMTASQILNEGLLAGMAIVGKKMGAHEIFLPEVLLAARAMSAGVDLLKPLLVAEDVKSLGKVVLGTMKGDMHDIGKNLVGIMLEGAGFEIVDLGTDVPPERFVEVAESEKACVVGLSALLTTTMTGMKKVVELLDAKGLHDEIKVIVGGAPLSQSFADEIGADAYGYDANVAVKLVKGFVGIA